MQVYASCHRCDSQARQQEIGPGERDAALAQHLEPPRRIRLALRIDRMYRYARPWTDRPCKRRITLTRERSNDRPPGFIISNPSAPESRREQPEFSRTGNPRRPRPGPMIRHYRGAGRRTGRDRRRPIPGGTTDRQHRSLSQRAQKPSTELLRPLPATGQLAYGRAAPVTRRIQPGAAAATPNARCASSMSATGRGSSPYRLRDAAARTSRSHDGRLVLARRATGVPKPSAVTSCTRSRRRPGRNAILCPRHQHRQRRGDAAVKATGSFAFAQDDASASTQACRRRRSPPAASIWVLPPERIAEADAPGAARRQGWSAGRLAARATGLGVRAHAQAGAAPHRHRFP